MTADDITGGDYTRPFALTPYRIWAVFRSLLNSILLQSISSAPNASIFIQG